MKTVTMFVIISILLMCIFICYLQLRRVKGPPMLIAIVAIFKNEQNYLQEWLDWHISQGIDHFYLYSNDVNIQNYPYLRDRRYAKYITLIEWTNKVNTKEGFSVQKQAYTHCIQNYKNQCQYLMMLDVDEFLVPVGDYINKTVVDVIDDLVVSKVTSAIKIPRYNYGSNGHKSMPRGGVMINYSKREKICSSYKTMTNTDFLAMDKAVYGVHEFPLIDNIDGKIYNNYFSYAKTGFPNGCKDFVGKVKNELPLVIKHYYTKSRSEYLDRCKLWKDGGVNNVNYRNNCEEKFYENDVNEVDDDVYGSDVFA